MSYPEVSSHRRFLRSGDTLGRGVIEKEDAVSPLAMQFEGEDGCLEKSDNGPRAGNNVVGTTGAWRMCYMIQLCWSTLFYYGRKGWISKG